MVPAGPSCAILTLTDLCREHVLALQGLECVASDGDQSQPGDVPLTQPPEPAPWQSTAGWPKVLLALWPRNALGSLPAGLARTWGSAARLPQETRPWRWLGSHPFSGIRHCCPRALFGGLSCRE